MTRYQLEVLLDSRIAECYIGDDAKELILDFAEAVQKATINQVLDDVSTILQNARQHILLQHQAG